MTDDRFDRDDRNSGEQGIACTLADARGEGCEPAVDRRSDPEAGRIEVRESALHGRGVFALSDFEEGERIGLFEGVPTQTDGMHVLWVVEEDGTEVGIEGRGALRFLNHAAIPNAEFDGQELFATRRVASGAEILIDYAAGWDEEDGEYVHAFDVETGVETESEVADEVADERAAVSPRLDPGAG